MVGRVSLQGPDPYARVVLSQARVYMYVRVVYVSRISPERPNMAVWGRGRGGGD